MLPDANVEGVRRPLAVPMPEGSVRLQRALAASTVDDGYRYRTIGSAPALLIAAAASLLTTVLLRIIL